MTGTGDVLHLGHEDVVAAASMADAIHAIALGCKLSGADAIVGGDRQNLRLSGGWIRLMPAAGHETGSRQDPREVMAVG